MRPSERLRQHRDAVRAIAQRRRVAAIKIFGSAARGQDREDSDLDLLVEPSEGTTLLDLGAIQSEVSELLGIRVDVVTPGSIPEQARQRVLAEAQPL
jgi:predicted nucleotidyltransferase